MAVEVTAYQRALRSGQGALRRAFLEAARRLLVEEGPGALTLRRIAGDVGCTTKVVYTMFGGKDGLAEALFTDGFERFRQRLLRIPAQDDPVAHLRALGVAYRQNALAVPDYYRVMFEQTIPGFVPSEEARGHSRAVFEILVRAVTACVTSGRFSADSDPEQVAHMLWATQHGVVSLELTGYLTHEAAERQHAALLDTVIEAHLTDHVF
ncbi:TetR/AcrR family transcriptional regulator [Streptomyces sp. A012304]|uniref:TetR/AcrR family transcriptional regulator n=1 Tax=Streptomyces sp. A012304 TaxID=375446 RepID=UPI0022304DEF|nr:TetR/AcrR family transcriptional regulator [Streptomyces sp. A012304]GKQ39059.1 TetR family transcriptional regulator [Streptomyces sp. A012304]